MELRHLRYFVAVAEEMHFTRAARLLGIGQPPLSQQIRALEDEIGTPLFQRLGRGVALTAAGEVFLHDARSLLANAEQAVENARRVARGESGRIRVGMINSAPFHPFVPRVIREFGLRYPGVDLKLDENSTPVLAAAVAEGELDLAFVRPVLGEDHRLVALPLFDEDMLVALPQGHPLSACASLMLSQLAAEPFVLFSRPVGSGLYDEIISVCQHAGFSPHITQETKQVTSIINLVAAGLGLSIVPASMQQIHSEGVTYRPIDGPAPVAWMHLIHRRGEDTLSTVRNMIELTRELVADSGDSSFAADDWD